MRSRVLLISINDEVFPSPVYPLGAAYLAAELEGRGYEVQGFDCCFTSEVEPNLRTALQKFRPDYVGLSLRNADNLTFNYTVSYVPQTRWIANIVRTAIPRVPMIIGGSGFSLFPREILEATGLCLGVVGSGEEVFPELLRRLQAGGSPRDLPGVAVLEDGTFTLGATTRGTPVPADLYPKRDIFDLPVYLREGGMANVQTKRGCSFKCIYCTYPYLEGRRILPRTPEAVGEELEQLVRQQGADYVAFVDNMFNVPPWHAEAICREILRRGLRLRWSAVLTPAGVRPDLLALMKEAGAVDLEIGIDAAEESMLRNLGKSFTLGAIRDVAGWCHEVGLRFACYLILGGPGETHETARTSLDNTVALNPTAIIIMVGVRVYPGTPMLQVAATEGVEVENLLTPYFYISRHLDVARFLDEVAEGALKHPNWVIPALGINSSPEVTRKLRALGARGPLWRFLSRQGGSSQGGSFAAV